MFTWGFIILSIINGVLLSMLFFKFGYIAMLIGIAMLMINAIDDAVRVNLLTKKTIRLLEAFREKLK